MRPWPRGLAALLIVLSFVTYVIHFLVFRDPHHIGIFLVGDIAFVFVEVLLVYLVLEELLERKERRQRLSKLDSLIGIFFSEVGMNLLAALFKMDKEGVCRDPSLATDPRWKGTDFSQAMQTCGAMDLELRPNRDDLVTLRTVLSAKHDSIIRLMENPVLMEHELFTDLLQAILHLTEEFQYINDLEAVTDEELEHLTEDCQRIYRLLLMEWFDHLRHLQKNYPYLYALAVRVNPLAPSTLPEA